MNISHIECFSRVNYPIVMRTREESSVLQGSTLDVRLFYAIYDPPSSALRVEVMAKAKEYLDLLFDQTTLVSCHDPLLDLLSQVEEEGGCDLRVFTVEDRLFDLETVGKIALKELTGILEQFSSTVTVQRLELIQRAQIIVVYPHDITL